MKRTLQILIPILLLSTICYSQTYQKHIYKKWTGVTGQSYLDNISILPRANKTDTLQIKKYIETHSKGKNVDDYELTGYKFYRISDPFGSTSISVYVDRIIIIISHYIYEGIKLTKEEETKIRKYQISLTEQIIKEINTL